MVTFVDGDEQFPLNNNPLVASHDEISISYINVLGIVRSACNEHDVVKHHSDHNIHHNIAMTAYNIMQHHKNITTLGQESLYHSHTFMIKKLSIMSLP
jgi:hypothetical protein